MSEQAQYVNESVQIVRGCPFPKAPFFKKQNIEDAMDHVPLDDDIIIASYPKTGTTWLQYIVLQIMSRGESFPTFHDATHKMVPFLEMSGIAAVEALVDKPRIYKHHIAYSMVQKNDKAKYIYIYRNPEDVVVSFYHFTKSLRLEGTEKIDFNMFFDVFVAGNISYGNYFQHVLSFHEHRDDANLLRLSYEKLHASRREGILRIAKFLGEEYHQCLLENEDVLNKVMEHTSFGYMKKNLYVTRPGAPDRAPDGEATEENTVNFFRKGIVGDGKNVLTDDQRQRLKEAALSVLSGTSIIDEWYPNMSEEEQKPDENIQTIRGCPFPNVPWFKKQYIEDAMDFVPKDDDVIIASYPKTGTTWLQYIVLQITSRGESFPPFDDVLYKVMPFLEMSGIAAVEALESKPRCYKHHINYDMVQKNDKAKYLYIYRNPEDTVVSFYQFMKSFQLASYDHVDFDEYFEGFMSGNIGYGNYFRHVLSYYEHRKDGNLLMISYEILHANRREGILRIAKFLGEEYHEYLLHNENVLNKVIEHTTFDYMKKNLYLTHPEAKSQLQDSKLADQPKVNFFRKGIVGDGKNVLTDHQRQRVKEAALKILNGTSIIDEWYPE